MIRWLVQILRDTAAALERWLAPEPQYATHEELEDVSVSFVAGINGVRDELKQLKQEVALLKDRNEKLALYTGLQRPIQTVVGDRKR